MAQQPDYLDYFKFVDQPFRLTPDPSFFFPAKPHFAAKEVLKYAIERGEGFMVLIGPAGAGKTLLLRMLFSELPANKIPAVVVTPAVDPQGLLELIIEEMMGDAIAFDGVNPLVVHGQSKDFASLLKQFQAALLRQASEGKELLIVIDEAQNLPLETLEQLRLLSNIETDRQKLLQILLVGQPELDELLKDKRLGQLTQRIAIREDLRALTLKEMQDYIAFRFAKAGRADLNISEKALKQIFKATHGLPRLVNRLMDRALLIAASLGDKELKIDHIKQACVTVPEPYLHSQARTNPFLMPVVLSVVVVVALVLAFAFAWHYESYRLFLKNLAFSAQAKSQTQPQTVQIVVTEPDSELLDAPDDKAKSIAVLRQHQVLTPVGNVNEWWKLEIVGKDNKSVIGFLPKSKAAMVETSMQGQGASK